MTDQATLTETSFPAYIDTHDELERLCDHLLAQPRIAVDTEFVTERTYFPALGIVQVACEGVCSVVDTVAIEDLSPLQKVLASPDILKVFHAGKQDLMVLYRVLDVIARPIFDSQVAAAFVGYGDQISYAKLAERVARVALSKHSGLTDWTKRPLSRKQISYALDDVRYLLPIYNRMTKKLQRMGRLDWCHEEFSEMEREEAIRPPEAPDLYRTVKRASSLDPKGLHILRSLAIWREEEAQRRDRLRQRVVTDELLVAIARLAPETEKALSSLRHLHPRERERSGAAIVERVRDALADSKELWPDITPPKRRRHRDVAGLVELLTAYVRCKAETEKIAPRLVGTRSELELFAKRYGEDGFDSPLVHGWRRNMIGNDLIEILEGRSAVGIDPETGQLQLRAAAPVT